MSWRPRPVQRVKLYRRLRSYDFPWRTAIVNAAVTHNTAERRWDRFSTDELFVIVEGFRHTGQGAGIEDAYNERVGRIAIALEQEAWTEYGLRQVGQSNAVGRGPCS